MKNAMAIALAGLAASTSLAARAAGLAEELAGTWSLVSVTYEHEGRKRESFGPDPKGFMSLHPNGRYSITLMRADLPRVASNDRENSTAEEKSAIAGGVLAHFGTYSVSDQDRTIRFRIQASSFANWDGATHVRPIASLNADELKWTVPTPAQGKGSAYLVWKRAR